MRPLPVEPNHLNTQALVHYFEEDWGGWCGDQPATLPHRNRRHSASPPCPAAAGWSTWASRSRCCARHGGRPRLRGGALLPTAQREIRTDVAILGSGIAGLTAAWRLARRATTTTSW